MSYAMGGLMVLAGLIVATNVRGAADWAATRIVPQLISKNGGIGGMRLLGVVWILFGVIAFVFLESTKP